MEKISYVYKCSECNTMNKISRKGEDNNTCSNCGVSLDIKSKYTGTASVTENTFKEKVLSGKGIVLVDCWAPGCVPCRMQSPLLANMQKDYTEKTKLLRLNVDANRDLVSTYGIFGLPTLLIFKDGKLINRLVGARLKPEIEHCLNNIFTTK